MAATMNLRFSSAIRYILFLFLLAGPVGARAETITWTNIAGGNWNVASNWSPNQAPTTNDIAVITNAGTYTVTLNLNATIAGLTLGGDSGAQTLSALNRTLTLNGGAEIGPNAVYVQAGISALEGTNRVLVRGLFRWEGGTLGTNAAVTVAPVGRMTIASATAHAKTLSGSLTNAGSVLWQPVGNLVINGLLRNLPGGLFDAQVSGTISGPGLFINDGLFLATPGSLSCNVPLINNGTVETLASQLTLAGGSVFNAGCAFIGAGQTWMNSGTNTINGSIHSDNLFLLYNGALAGTGSVSGILTWGGGNIGPGASITIQTNALLRIESGANYGKVLYGSLTNEGTITWKPPGGLYLAGPLHNSGLFDAQSGGTISQGPTGLIINDGVFRSSTGPLTCEVPMVNNGTVQTLAGVFALASGSVLNSGCAFTGTGQTWIHSGTNAITGAIHSENLFLLYSATLAGTGSFAGTLTWGGGNIGPGAALTVQTNAQLRIESSANYGKFLYGSLTNAGTITWKPTGGLYLAGPLHNSGLFDAQLGGTISQGGPGLIINEGVFRSSGGPLTCDVSLLNNGTVESVASVLTLASGSVFNAGCAFTGAGQTWMNSGTNTISGSFYSENLFLLYNASLSGTGSFSGTLTWAGGNIGPGASVTVRTNGELLVESAANYAKVLYGSLTNEGTITWKPTGSLVLAGPLHNLGRFQARLGGTLSRLSDGLIINDGLFEVAATPVSCDVPFANRGIARVSSTTFSFENSFSNPTGQIQIEGGTFRSALPLVLAGGQLTGWGNVWADVTNAACVRPSATNGILKITGRYRQMLAGRLEFELGGTSSGANHSRLEITDTAVLRGAVGIHWSPGFLVTPGTEFQVLSFPSRQGEFCSFDNCYLLGQNCRVVPVYGAKIFALMAVAAPDPTTVPLSIGVDGISALVSWPVEFPGYALYCTTNLSLPDWTLLPGVTNRWLEYPLVPYKFFRLFPQ
jgi:hypothetical protein